MKFRLRVENIVSGYLEIRNETYFYSKDMYGWTNQPIEFRQKDLCLDLKDKQGNVLFHGDMCVKNKEELIILFFKNDKWYEINNMNYSYSEIEQTLDYSKNLKRFDFLYDYPEKEVIIQKVIK